MVAAVPGMQQSQPTPVYQTAVAAALGGIKLVSNTMAGLAKLISYMGWIKRTAMPLKDLLFCMRMIACLMRLPILYIFVTAAAARWFPTSFLKYLPGILRIARGRYCCG